jgi:hypothetical protein
MAIKLDKKGMRVKRKIMEGKIESVKLKATPLALSKMSSLSTFSK